MNPVLKYLKHLFAGQRILGNESALNGLVKANGLLQDLIDDKKIPGLAISVRKEGQPILQKGYGYSDLDNKVYVDPKATIFRIASVSKPIAATALAHMVKDGHIDLDQSFYHYAPYFPKKEWDFTIRQLAGHTAGLRSYRGMEYALNKPYTIKESLEIFKNDALQFKPGTAYHYNSFDWVLISLAIQEASGIPFENYVREKVLGPLGMTNTYIPERQQGENHTTDHVSNNKVLTVPDGARVTSFYSKNRFGFRKAVEVNNFYKLAGGGYLSTVEDIAKLGQAYLEGTVMDSEILSQFTTMETINGTPTYYGLGWQVSQDKKGRPYFGHVGNGVGGYANFYVYPEEQMVFAILINCTDPKVQGQLDEVIETLVSIYASSA